MALFDRRGRWSCGATNSYEEHCGVRSRTPACRKCFEISSLGRSICMSPPKDTEDIMVTTIHSTEQFFERFPRLFHVFNRTQSFVQMGEIRFLTVPRLASRNIPSTFLHAYYLVVCWECRWVSLQFLFPDFAQRFFYSLVILDIQKGIRRNKVKVTCTFTDYIHRNM